MIAWPIVFMSSLCLLAHCAWLRTLSHASVVHKASVSPCAGALKTIIAEAFNEHQQAQVMGYMSFGWGAGTILGPVIGGLLSLPCGKAPQLLGALCADGGLFAVFPYALPCLLSAVAVACSFAVAWLLLPETLEHGKPLPGLAWLRTALGGRGAHSESQPVHAHEASHARRRPHRKSRSCWDAQQQTRGGAGLELVPLKAAGDDDAASSDAGSDTVPAEPSARQHRQALPAARSEQSPFITHPEPHQQSLSLAHASAAGARSSCDTVISMGNLENSMQVDKACKADRLSFQAANQKGQRASLPQHCADTDGQSPADEAALLAGGHSSDACMQSSACDKHEGDAKWWRNRCAKCS